MDFNPRSREGSDRESFGRIAKMLISIHAPAKGATNLLEFDIKAVYISIHAPAKGATYLIFC